MKKLIITFLFLILSSAIFGQVKGIWEIESPEYNWNKIYEYYDVKNITTQYGVEKLVTTYVNHIEVIFMNNGSMVISTIDNEYYGKYYSLNDNKYNGQFRINNESVIFKFYYNKKTGKLTVDSDNYDFDRIVKVYLFNKIKLIKLKL